MTVPSWSEPGDEPLHHAVGRVSIGYVVRQVKLGRLGFDFVDGLILLAVTQANIEQVMRDPDLQRTYATYDQPPPPDLRRPISISRIAQSLRLPYETARRRISRLSTLGLCRVNADGVVAATSIVQNPLHRAAVQSAYGGLRSLYMRLADIGAVKRAGPADEAWSGAPPLRAAARISAEYMLRFVDQLTGRLDDPIRAAIWLEIFRASSEHLPDAPQSGAPTWKPTRTAEIARRMGAPAETVRRRVAQLVAEGACRWDATGLLVAPETFGGGTYDAFLRRNHMDLERMFAGLEQLGILGAWEQEHRLRQAS